MTVDEKRLREIIAEMQVHEASSLRALLYAEEVRLRAETDMLRYREQCRDMTKELAELRHASPKRIGGTFVKRDRFPEADHELVREVLPVCEVDEFRWKWSKGALYSGMGHGYYGSLEGSAWQAMPRKLRADSWWHVCAKIGITEGVARLCYFHPEDDYVDW